MDLIERVTKVVNHAQLFRTDMNDVVIMCHQDTRREFGDAFAELRGHSSPGESLGLESCMGLPFYETRIIPPGNFLIVKRATAELMEVSEEGCEIIDKAVWKAEA